MVATQQPVLLPMVQAPSPGRAPRPFPETLTKVSWPRVAHWVTSSTPSSHCDREVTPLESGMAWSRHCSPQSPRPSPSYIHTLLSVSTSGTGQFLPKGFVLHPKPFELPPLSGSLGNTALPFMGQESTRFQLCGLHASLSPGPWPLPGALTEPTLGWREARWGWGLSG